MADFFEIEFLDVESTKSGDAIPIRYSIGGETFIHIVDGGFQATGQSIVEHVRRFYGNPTYIDHVVATHNDHDHAGGLRTVLEEFDVGALWMLRPWRYAAYMIDRFARFTSVAGLETRLREIYSNLAALEEIAEERGIEIKEPFQGQQIGAFTVLAPTPARFLDLIVESERTPQAVVEDSPFVATLKSFMDTAGEAIRLVKASWGIETFSEEGSSAENAMSVVQYANLCGQRILLTADADRDALWEAAAFAPKVGLVLPGLDRVQVPHHGSRRNVSTELLDTWLGPRWPVKPQRGQETFSAICSSAKADEKHPRKSVMRAFIHRGGRFIATESQSVRSQQNAGARDGWSAAVPMDYPEEQEES